MESAVVNISGYEVLISVCDLERVSAFKWYAYKRKNNNEGPYFLSYRKTKTKYIRISLHRLIMNNPIGKCVDHINGNTLDNRQNNLRVCKHAENIRNQKKRIDNTSGYKGVYWHKRLSKWRVQIRHNNKRIHLGYFETAIDAHEAYCDAVQKYHGEFGRFE